LGSKAAAVNANRLAALRELQYRYGGTVLLKGAGTLVLSGSQATPSCVTGGHPGMATAGMGDVLTGIIGALRAQGLDADAAAVTAAAWHIAAACTAAQRLGGQRGLLAGDVIQALPASGAGAGA